MTFRTAKVKQPPKRKYKCLDCGDEIDWNVWNIPTHLICKCGGTMLEVMGRKDDGASEEVAASDAVR